MIWLYDNNIIILIINHLVRVLEQVELRKIWLSAPLQRNLWVSEPVTYLHTTSLVQNQLLR